MCRRVIARLIFIFMAKYKKKLTDNKEGQIQLFLCPLKICPAMVLGFKMLPQTGQFSKT